VGGEETRGMYSRRRTRERAEEELAGPPHRLRRLAADRPDLRLARGARSSRSGRSFCIRAEWNSRVWTWP
jgi:hypothetical protein